MAEVPENLESSLPVPSVQDLVIQGLNIVPSIYIRDNVEDTCVSFASSNVLRVPLIDMSKLVNPDLGILELQKLHSACKDRGIFQLINHEVSNEMLANMGEQAQEFFALPAQEKKQWAQKPGSLQGYGQAFVTSEDQKLD